METYDERSICEKCGGELISTKYDENFNELVRKCVRCGHIWRETPLSKKK